MLYTVVITQEQAESLVNALMDGRRYKARKGPQHEQEAIEYGKLLEEVVDVLDGQGLAFGGSE